MAKTQRVKFTRSHKGYDGASFAAGAEVELPADIAKRLIAEGKAEEVKPAAAKKDADIR